MTTAKAMLRNRGLLAGLACGAVLASVGGVLARTYTAVDVRGAEFIPEQNITAACGVEPGAAYSDADLAGIETCLMASGAFRSVSASPEGETLVIAVDELNDRPGRLEFGLAWDSRDGATASLYMERYNLLPGVFGSVELRAARDVQDLRAALYRADAFGGLGFGIDTLLQRSSFDDQGFDSRRAVVEPYLAWPATQDLRLELGLGYRMDEMHSLSRRAGPVLSGEAGRVRSPYLRLSFDYSHETGAEGRGLSGVHLRADQMLVGLGDGESLSETRITAGAAVALGHGFSLDLSAQGGAVHGLGGGSSRALDRFYPGGAEFRGFAPRGISPREAGYALGSERYFVLSAELQADIGTLMGVNSRLGAFVSTGSAWDLGGKGAGAIDDGFKRRSSVGISLTMDIGSVPVSLYIAEPVEFHKGDRRQNFGLSIATRF